MIKEQELIEIWNKKRDELNKALIYHDKRLLFRLIMEYGDAQEAKAIEQTKRWMIKKLGGENDS